MRFPVLVKANIGGSGAGIARFETLAQMTTALERKEIQLGLDGTALVQEQLPLRGGHINRVEVLGRKFLYAIRVYPAEDSFNLCPADVCCTTDGAELARGACALDAPKNGMRVEAFTPSQEIISQVERLAERAQLDVGGVEYLLDENDGRPQFYDLNALSNFVADPMRVVGFDPFERLADYLLQRVNAPRAGS
jgi:biotin carboxylase